MIKKGEYVLATKYTDGDPQDHWCVGFYSIKIDDRHYIVDNNGIKFRTNGFRRVAKISKALGKYLLSDKHKIERSNRSLWWWKKMLQVGEK